MMKVNAVTDHNDCRIQSCECSGTEECGHECDCPVESEPASKRGSSDFGFHAIVEVIWNIRPDEWSYCSGQRIMDGGKKYVFPVFHVLRLQLSNQRLLGVHSHASLLELGVED